MWNFPDLFSVLCLFLVCASELSSAEKACGVKHFRCADALKCIPLTWVCDGENDCDDNSDETKEECPLSSSCSSVEFRCNSGRCIPKRWQCDMEKDCSDGSDEDPKLCEQKVCGTDEFSCRSNPGECVPLTWMCDDNPDCKDGSDEKACNETCRSDEFTCANAKCIQMKWRCDLDNDCGDNSDEKDCPPITCNLDTQFQCSENYCITARWKCDGDFDCPDGKDEQGCPPTEKPPSPCREHQFRCKTSLECIDPPWVCDGHKDCHDGSDEEKPYCNKTKPECRADQFQCADFTCISGRFYCDGDPDCSDGSDELNCHAPPVKCDPKTEFECANNSCIPFSMVCDGHRDCPNGEDEPTGSCGHNECNKDNGGCNHKCIDTPASYYCECDKGYKLVDNHTCKDIDECELPGSCSQICINEKGTFKCECERGYMRDPRDLTRCKATEGHASLLFARRRDIRKISLDHHEMTSIVNDTNTSTALDFVFRTGMIFWSDITDQKIYKAPIDEGNERTVVIKEELTTADGLAVDWIYNHIYWTDTGKNTIELANFEGQMRKVLIKDELEEPRAIALNPIEGWMFWTDWGQTPKIERAGMDGSHRQTIISYMVKWPNGLTLDLVKKHVYWVDAKLNVISSCNYDGSGRRVILDSPKTLRQPFSITTFEDWLYWTDWDKSAVYKANKFTGKDVKAITAIEMIHFPMAIHVYHPYRQPDGENYCQAVNGHCSHLCLPAPQINMLSPKISCACPENLKMLPDGLTCVQDGTGTDNKSHIDDIVHMADDANSGTVALIVIVSVTCLVVVIALIAYMAYKHHLHRNMTSMNFDNPVYRKTTEDQFSLEKNARPPKICPSTVREEAQEPLTGNQVSDYV